MRAQRTPHTCLIVAVALAVGLPKSSPAQTLSIDQPGTPVHCDDVEVTADTMECAASACQLDGRVHMACEGLDLWADHLTITLAPDRSFSGAEANGHVLMVERGTVLTCKSMSLGADRVRGRIDDASFHIKRDRTEIDERGVPNGLDQARLTGDIERIDSRHLHIEDATFTLCGCSDDPMFWELRASEVDITLGERATLWWPQPWQDLFGLGLLPGPPLPPMSLPLEDRAAGLLPPELAFLDRWPTVDLPVFVPLGRSWDITVAPGMRLGWGTHHLTPVSTWGAPRLGGRIRYAPHASTSGEIRVQWTFDRKHQAARLYAKKLDATPDEIHEGISGLEPNQVASFLGREALEHRVSLELEHRTDLSDELTWLVAAEWLSDDLVINDFKVTLEDRVANYIPSRTQLLWRRAGATGVVAADYLLSLSNSKATTHQGPIDYSNIHGREAGVGHRGPHGQLALLPFRLFQRLHVDAELAFTRYGPWTDVRKPDRVIGAANAGLSYLDHVGPVNLRAQGRVDTLWLDPTSRDTELQSSIILDASASMRLAKSVGKLTHVVEPRLAYRGLPWLSGTPPPTPAVDPRLERRQLHQVAVEIAQTWYRKSKGGHRRLGRFVVSQPMDMESGEALHTHARVDATVPGAITMSAWADVDLPGGGTVDELGATASKAWGLISVGGEYGRWTPNADRFRRSLYELGATGPVLADTAWVHMVRGRLGLRLGQRITASYSTDYLLPVPLDCALPASTESWAQQCKANGELAREPGFTRHVVTAVYRSPCDCWQLAATLNIPTTEDDDVRASLSLTVGGIALGE